MVMDVLLVPKDDPKNRRKAQTLSKKLEKKGIKTHVITERQNIRCFKGIVITLGGDGTFLLTAQKVGCPILPVKTGGVGFLCNVEYKELMRRLNDLLARKYKIIKFMRLFSGEDYPQALNEIVISRKYPSKLLELEYIIDGIRFSFAGDGVIFSTPWGSTAYNASAGGPVVDPVIDSISITPVNSFYSSVKPLVVPANKEIRVTVKRSRASIVVDGQGVADVEPGESFIVKKGTDLKVINMKRYNFYEKLRKTFFRDLFQRIDIS
jgi:NAD+ kinase